MSDLRKGHVLIQNWHVLAPQEMNQVGGVGARVVKRGEESDTALVARVLGKEVGAKGNILVLNDEAHHAYRIRRLDDTDELEEEDELAEADEREATVWIEGLDKIHRVRGINLCVDLSATPFYLHRAGADPGRAFPWIVSDFGLIDAIESGLVKIPQLPVQDATGREIPAYFNVWKWIVEEKLTAGERGGRRGQVKPEAVLRWAQHPIAQLAGLWREEFLRWQRETAEGKRPSVPPVFISSAAIPSWPGLSTSGSRERRPAPHDPWRSSSTGTAKSTRSGWTPRSWRRSPRGSPRATRAGVSALCSIPSARPPGRAEGRRRSTWSCVKKSTGRRPRREGAASTRPSRQAGTSAASCPSQC